jgi:Tfp pilus assembly protein PilO
MNPTREDGTSATGRFFVLWAGGVVLGLIVYGAVIQSPLDRRALIAARERPKLEETVRALEITVAKFPEFQRDVAAVQEKLETLRRVLPTVLRGDDVRAALERLAARSHVELVFVRPVAGKAERLPNGSYATSFDVTVRGRVSDVATFFDHMDRAVPMLETRSAIVERDGSRYRARASVVAFVDVPPVRPRPRKP